MSLKPVNFSHRVLKDVAGVETYTDAINTPHSSLSKELASDKSEYGEIIIRTASQVSRSTPTTFSNARLIALVATVTGASFLNTVSIQAIVIILPTIGKDLDIPESRQQWIVSAYALTSGCFLLLWGRVGDLYGKRKIFILGSAWVSALLIVNPFLPNEIAFILFRGLQGIGAAANVPTAIGILGTTFPPGKAKNYAFSTYGAGAPMGSIFGNLLGGLISSYAHWTWVFWALATLAALVSVAGYFVIPLPPRTLHDQGVKADATVDWIGAVMITVGSMLLLFSLTEGNVAGWTTLWVPSLTVVSVFFIAFFIFRQLHLETKAKQTPLIQVYMFRKWRFSAAMLTIVFIFACFNNYLIFTTYYFQGFQNLSTLQTTLRYIPTGVVGTITATVTGKLLAIIPTYFLLIFGNLCCATACLLFAVPIPPTTTYFAYGLPAMILAVFGTDTTWPCLTLFISLSLPQADQAMGGAMVNAAGQFGRAIGLALGTAVQTAVMASQRGVSVQDSGPLKPWDWPSLQGLQAAQYHNFGLGLLGLLVVVLAFRNSGTIGRVGVNANEPKDLETTSSFSSITEA